MEMRQIPELRGPKDLPELEALRAAAISAAAAAQRAAEAAQQAASVAQQASLARPAAAPAANRATADA
jgi:hypothetical protein